jgi:hypothetical protein
MSARRRVAATRATASIRATRRPAVELRLRLVVATEVVCHLGRLPAARPDAAASPARSASPRARRARRSARRRRPTRFSTAASAVCSAARTPGSRRPRARLRANSDRLRVPTAHVEQQGHRLDDAGELVGLDGPPRRVQLGEVPNPRLHATGTARRAQHRRAATQLAQVVAGVPDARRVQRLRPRVAGEEAARARASSSGPGFGVEPAGTRPAREVGHRRAGDRLRGSRSNAAANTLQVTKRSIRSGAMPSIDASSTRSRLRWRSGSASAARHRSRRAAPARCARSRRARTRAPGWPPAPTRAGGPRPPRPVRRAARDPRDARAKPASDRRAASTNSRAAGASRQPRPAGLASPRVGTRPRPRCPRAHGSSRG